MPAKYEYKTTQGDTAYTDCGGDHGASDPEPPDGDGWEMCGMAANARHIYWSWKRAIPD